MMIEAVKMYLFPTIMSTMIALFLHSDILKIKLDLKSFRFYIGFIIATILLMLNRVFVYEYLRFVFSFIIMLISSSIIFRKKVYELYGVVFAQQGLIFVAELICLVIFNITDRSLLSISDDNYFNSILVNAVICVMTLLLYSSDRIYHLCCRFVSFVNDVVGLSKYLLILFFITTSNVLLMFMYFEDDIIILVNTAFIAVYGCIVYFLITEVNEKLKIKQQNEDLIRTLNEYERILDQQRVNNHENKNLLLVLKSLAGKNNKKLLTYLDEIIKEKQVDDEVLYAGAKRIPQGGLQGLIYQKMLYMKDKGINVVLNVDRKVKKTSLINVKPKVNFESCRAIGIILDNAIEETIKHKDKEIFIDVYLDDDFLCVSVANQCFDVPDLSKIDEGGYTTKSEGHGYGLTLLKEICDFNREIINERRLSGLTFSQIIKIKM